LRLPARGRQRRDEEGMMVDYARAYLERTADIALRIQADVASRIAEVLIAACEAGRTIFVMGNGGSSATATHFANDLAKGGMNGFPRRFRIMCLNDNMALVTAWANDTEYGRIFSEQLRNFIEPGDVVIGFSGSGNSPNVLNAIRLAKQIGGLTVGFTGLPGGVLRTLADHCLVVPSSDMQHIEDLHLVAAHLIYSQIRDEYMQPLATALAGRDGVPLEPLIQPAGHHPQGHARGQILK